MSVISKNPQYDASQEFERFGEYEKAEHVADLLKRVAREIQLATSSGIRGLKVVWEERGVVLYGHCRTFYTKQLAQKMALTILGDDEVLINAIHVH